MAKWYDIDTDTRINGSLSANSIVEGGTQLSSKYLGINSNAFSASKWQTGRKIILGGDASGEAIIDGSSDVTLILTIADDSHAHTISNIDGLQAELDGKLLATANAVSASKLETPRVITLSGDITGSVSFDGSTDISIVTAISDDSHNHIIANVDGLQTALDGKLSLAGGTMTSGLLLASSATGGATTATPTALTHGKLQSFGNLLILSNTDNSATDEYVLIASGYGMTPTTAQGLKVGKTELSWQGSNVWHTGNLTPITTGINQSIGTGFTIKGVGYLGDTTSSGDLVVKGSSNISTIHLDGDSSGKIDSTNIKSYIAGNGNADFKGTVTVQTLAVNTSTLVNNLNAKYLNGVEEISLAKNESLSDIGGYGVQSGLGATAQTVPNMTVKIGAGVAYTNTGRRIVLPDTNITVTTASTAYGRNDIIYLQGSSAGANEGKLAIATGTPTASPVDPTIPSDSIAVARVRVPQNIGSITDGTSGTTDLVDDLRIWKPVFMAGDSLYVREITPGTYGANGTSATFNKPIKNSTMAKSITIAKGNTSSTWTHNLPFGTNYAVQLSCNSSEPHVSWSSKTPTAITVSLDDVCDDDVIVDIIIVGY